MSDKPKPINDEEMEALVQKLCEEHGANGVEITFDMPPADGEEEGDYVRFYYGDEAEQHGDVKEAAEA